MSLAFQVLSGAAVESVVPDLARLTGIVNDGCWQG